MSADSPEPRIGYVLKKFPRLSETFILNEVLGLEERGVEVSVHSLRLPDEGRFHTELARLKATVDYLPEPRSAATYEALETVARIPGATPEKLRRALAFCDRLPEGKRLSTLLQGMHLAGRVRDGGLTHLHAHFMTVAAHTAYVAHVLCGVPFSVTAHAKDIYRTSVDREVFAEMAAAAAAVVTVCEANRRFIEAELLRGVDARVETVYNGLPLRELEALPRAPEPGLILGIGRLVEKKGFRRLVTACARLRDRGHALRCVLIGEGEERDAIEAAVRDEDLGDAVSLLGACTRDEVLHWLGRAWVLAAPCVTGADGNRDALPTVIIEAMALGVPVVSTPVGGIPEMIDQDVEGLIVPEGDDAALGEALERVLRDPALRRRLSEGGGRKVRARFDRDVQLDRLGEIFGIDAAASAGLPR